MDGAIITDGIRERERLFGFQSISYNDREHVTVETMDAQLLTETSWRSTMRDSHAPGSISWAVSTDRAGVAYADACVVIQGIVSPSGQGGWFPDKSGYMVHCFEFAAWRRLGGPIIKHDLTILRPIRRDADWRTAFPEYTVHRISVLLATDERRAAFEKSLPFEGTDGELIAFGNELRKPVVVSTAVLGDLVLDRGIGWFEGEANWNEKLITIHVHTDDSRSIDNALKTAELLWSNQSHWKRAVDDFAVKKLLPLKNGNWLEDGETPLTPSQFVRRMSLESITISRDGGFQFWHDDGDLFWGHSIEIRGNPKDGLTDADIPG
jgi:hypothetical protein